MSLCRLVGAAVVAGLLGPVAMAQDATTGSGFFVNEQGWLMTNRHVVDGCGAVEVNGIRGISVILDEAADLALVHAPQAGGNTRLTLRRNGADLAEPMALVGYPLPELLSEGIKITVGVVSALEGPRSDARYFQMSAAAQPGNSGGPVVDENGLVIGVFAATLSEAAFDGGQNLNFAVGMPEVFRFLAVSDVAFREMTWPRGAVVQLGGPTMGERAVEASAAVALVRCVP